MNQSMRQTMRRRGFPLGFPLGFTLLELMVASSLSLIVLAAALWSAAELQRRGTFEESLMEAQNTLRAVRELLVVEIQRAGMGVGSARLMFGNQTGQGKQADPRYALVILNREIFDGNGYFAKDTSFRRPSASGPYKDLVSDVLQVWSWDSGVLDEKDSPIGMVTLRECRNPDSPHAYRVGDTLCATNAPEGLEGRLIMVVRPGKLSACVMRVTKVETEENTYGKPSVLTVKVGLSDTHVVNDDVCKKLPSNQPASNDFWMSGGSDAYVLLMRGSTFRVNWQLVSGTTREMPVLERQDISSLNETSVWKPLTNDVETLRFWQGVMSDPRVPTMDMQWFPDPAAKIPGYATQELPSIELCPRAQRPNCADFANSMTRLPGVDQLPSPLLTNERERLMYRLRMVRVEVVTRTARQDSSLIRETSPGNGNYILDDYNRPQDGYKRRSSTLEIMPRNFAFASGRQ